MDHSDPLRQFEETRSRSQLLRAEAIRTQIMAAFTMCDTLVAELRSHPGQSLRPSLEKLRRSAGGFQRHIDEPNHIPFEAKPKLSQLLSRLESRLTQLEKMT